MTDKTNFLGISTLVAILILLIALFVGAFSSNVSVDEETIVNGVVAGMPVPQLSCPSVNVSNNKVDAIYGELFEDEISEDKAEELALVEIQSRDVKKAIAEALVNAGEDLESYRDIDKITVKDSDVELDGEEATVEIEVKVDYHIDGDKDETERARLTITIDVEELDSEEEYVDAEAELDDVVLNKIYG